MIDKDGDRDENHMDGDHDSDYDLTLRDYIYFKDVFQSNSLHYMIGSIG